MGLYPDGHLVFGVPVSPTVTDYGDDHYGEVTHPLFDADDRDYDVAEFLAKRAGHQDPWAEFNAAVERGEVRDDNGGYETWCAQNPDWTKRKEAWYEIKRGFGDSCPVEVRQIGHFDDPDTPPTFLALKDKEFRADAWSPLQITDDMLEVPDEEIDTARQFCEDNGLPLFADPQWYLVASYG